MKIIYLLTLAGFFGFAHGAQANDDTPWLTGENWQQERENFINRRSSPKRAPAPQQRLAEEPVRTLRPSQPAPQPVQPARPGQPIRPAKAAPPAESFEETEEAEETEEPMLAEGQEPMPEEPTPAEDEEGSKFTVAPLVGFYSLSSRMPTVGENYKINSDPSYGVAFVWAQSHKKRFRTAIHASVDQRKFLPSIGRTLAERDQTIWGLGLEAGYRFNSWLELVGDVAAKHELFLKRVDGLSLSIERVVIPQASLGFDFLLLDLDGTKLKAGARGHFFYERIGSTATAFSAKSGFGFSQSVSITRPFARHFSLGLSYLHLQRDQDTKISEQSEDLNKVFFNVTFSI